MCLGYFVAVGVEVPKKLASGADWFWRQRWAGVGVMKYCNGYRARSYHLGVATPLPATPQGPVTNPYHFPMRCECRHS